MLVKVAAPYHRTSLGATCLHGIVYKATYNQLLSAVVASSGAQRIHRSASASASADTNELATTAAGGGGSGLAVTISQRQQTEADPREGQKERRARQAESDNDLARIAAVIFSLMADLATAAAAVRPVDIICSRPEFVTLVVSQSLCVCVCLGLAWACLHWRSTLYVACCYHLLLLVVGPNNAEHAALARTRNHAATNNNYYNCHS